jgi:hypothetical protein
MALQSAPTIADELRVTVKNTFVEVCYNDIVGVQRVCRRASAPPAWFNEDLFSLDTDVESDTDIEPSSHSSSPTSFDGSFDGTKLEVQLEAPCDKSIVVNSHGESPSCNSVGRSPCWADIDDENSDDDDGLSFQIDQMHDTDIESSSHGGIRRNSLDRVSPSNRANSGLPDPYVATKLASTRDSFLSMNDADGTSHSRTSAGSEQSWIDSKIYEASLEVEVAKLRARVAQLKAAKLKACAGQSKAAPECMKAASGRDGSQLSSGASGVAQQRGFHANSFAQSDGCIGRTTVMLRNLPNNYTRDMLVELLEEQGFRACLDFIYLPVDFKKKSGLGYAFINLISNGEALRALKDLQGFQHWKGRSQKRLQVSWSGLQGLQANVNYFRNSAVMHADVPEKFKPMIFNNGVPLNLPSANDCHARRLMLQ